MTLANAQGNCIFSGKNVSENKLESKINNEFSELNISDEVLQEIQDFRNKFFNISA